jgi:hypothetical protein
MRLLIAKIMLMAQKVLLQIYNIMFHKSLDLWKVIHEGVVAIVHISGMWHIFIGIAKVKIFHIIFWEIMVN